jgi:hypothetical protein
MNMKKRKGSVLAYLDSLGVSLDKLQEEILREYWRQKKAKLREKQTFLSQLEMSRTQPFKYPLLPKKRNRVQP